MLGRTMNTSTIDDWIKKEAEYRRQAAGVYEGSSNKKPLTNLIKLQKHRLVLDWHSSFNRLQLVRKNEKNSLRLPTFSLKNRKNKWKTSSFFVFVEKKSVLDLSGKHWNYPESVGIIRKAFWVHIFRIIPTPLYLVRNPGETELFYTFGPKVLVDLEVVLACFSIVFDKVLITD